MLEYEKKLLVFIFNFHQQLEIKISNIHENGLTTVIFTKSLSDVNIAPRNPKRIMGTLQDIEVISGSHSFIHFQHVATYFFFLFWYY